MLERLLGWLTGQDVAQAPGTVGPELRRQAPGTVGPELRRVDRKLDRLLAQLGIAPDRPDPAFADEIARLVQSGRKIEAIKLYRERTGVGLKDAKDAVESGATDIVTLEAKVDLLLDHFGVDDAADPHREVVDLIRAGRKIEAIKHYREATGAGLAEAKAAVDRIESTGFAS